MYYIILGLQSLCREQPKAYSSPKCSSSCLDRKPLVEDARGIILLLDLPQFRQARTIDRFRGLIAVCEVDISIVC
jgi:hypothetical protein